MTCHPRSSTGDDASIALRRLYFSLIRFDAVIIDTSMQDPIEIDYRSNRQFDKQLDFFDV
ncbi:hypothetical protein OAG56_02770 [Mariniblastus sp.]|nr:hypothetical protein [Mariniblastus sp.]MDB4756270.1 hypothetical protein [Mariniblastus sp.]